MQGFKDAQEGKISEKLWTEYTKRTPDQDRPKAADLNPKSARDMVLRRLNKTWSKEEVTKALRECPKRANKQLMPPIPYA
jgi:hypothetical protein